jgi:hypothetical protein
VEFVVHLKPEPRLRRHPEVTGQTQRRIRRDSTLADLDVMRMLPSQRKQMCHCLLIRYGQVVTIVTVADEMKQLAFAGA